MKIHLRKVQNGLGKRLHFTSRFIHRDHATAHKGAIVSGIKSPFELSTLATINGRELKSHPGKKNYFANTALKDQVMEMHPQHLLVSLRAMEVKASGGKSSPNSGRAFDKGGNQTEGYYSQEAISVSNGTSAQRINTISITAFTT